MTVVTGSSKQDWTDFEIPSDLPVAEVTHMLAKVITEEELHARGGPYLLEVKTKTGDWRKLDETQTLDDCMITDGAYLRIQTKQAHEDWHALIADQLELLSKEKLKESLEAWRT
ncbi:EsaB/YukD family protein [Lihuaxuella thermophila]|uniref:WXG100 protein secretion system (Wss), protein YukD n=1 Tax=Lihuaxuella thermophila TaxID=1173111 RepID=A0A1H8CGY1_9BACL|nr:EsaB/YukD family protein [Lihuaxuella thermophila]SEM94305.1 WXG100 protein secretion system (Wss), protein YukD [Lihuaxuella thermophila]